MDTREARVADRMRRAWAQLLREMHAEGLDLPHGADIRIREDNGDLTADVTLVDAPDAAAGGASETDPARAPRKAQPR